MRRQNIHFLYFIVSILSTISITSFGQGYMPPSPNAAGLMRHANIPVNLSTGIANVSVPLFELPAKNMAIPVYLSYHTSGIKVNDVASPVGLGWALNAGGAITRIVRGLPDEVDYSGRQQHGKGSPDIEGIAIGLHDGEPDIFFFNFMGRTGKFVIDADGETFLITKEDITITPAIGIKGIGKWIFTDESGTRFVFGQTEMEREVNTVYSKGDLDPDYFKDRTYISTWYLSEIISESNISLAKFEYKSGNPTQNIFFVDTKADRINNDCEEPTIYAKRLFYKVISELKYIDNISSQSGKILFNYESTRKDLTGARSVRSIAMTDYEGREVKTYNFEYEYFDASSSNYVYDKIIPCLGQEECFRLKLNAIRILKESNVEPYRSFEYNKINLPPRNTTFTDTWGYYRGIPGSFTELFFKPAQNVTEGRFSSIPEVTIDGITFWGANRDANPTYAVANILEQINLPSGGIQKFYFEGNEGGGGLRIRKIDNIDPSSNRKITTEYNYFDAQNHSKPVYHYQHEFLREDGLNYGLLGDIFNINNNNDCRIKYLIRKSESFTAVNDLNGASVTYGKVVQKLSNGSSSIFLFSNEADIKPSVRTSPCPRDNSCATDPYGPPFAPSTFIGYARGLLKKRIDLNSEGDTVQIVSNKYDVKTRTHGDSSVDFLRGVVVQSDLKSGNQSIYHIANYDVKSSYVRLISSQTDYFGGKYSSKISAGTTFEYHPTYKTLIKKSTTEDSKGRLIATTYKYPIDYQYQPIEDSSCELALQDCLTNSCNDCITNPGGQECAACTDACYYETAACDNTRLTKISGVERLNELHIINPVIEKQVLVVKDDIEKLLSAELIEYKIENELVVPFRQYSFSSSDGVVGFRNSALDSEGSFTFDNRYILENTFDKYDTYGNILVQTSRNQAINTFEWGYNHSLLLAKNENVGTNNVMRTEYIHRPLVGIQSIRDPNGYITSFEYDQLNRLLHVRDHDGNIISKNEYRYVKSPKWEDSGRIRCAKDKDGANTGGVEKEQKDTNTQSYQFGTTRWTTAENAAQDCPLSQGNITLRFINTSRGTYSLIINNAYIDAIDPGVKTLPYEINGATSFLISPESELNDYHYTLKVNGVFKEARNVQAGTVMDFLNMILYENDIVEFTIESGNL